MANEKKCAIPLCGSLVRARGMCQKHYNRFIRTDSTDLRRKLVCGVGLNDAPYQTAPMVNGTRKLCPYYCKWTSMLKRCYSSDWHRKKPTYKGCEVSQEWESFMNFRSWMMFQDWKGKDLDKDLIYPGNKLYSAETCVFISQHVNKILCDNSFRRGRYPTGISWAGRANKFVASISLNGKNFHIGLFENPDEAHNAYILKKCEYVLQIAEEQTDSRVRSRLIEFSTNLMRGLAQNQ